MIVLHYTGMVDRDEALDRLTDPMPPKHLEKVSAHYLIDEDGTIYRMVPESKRAWHAGVSFWDGITDINSASIGIELVNPGHSLGYSRFPLTQMQAVTQLCQDIAQRYDIRQDYVLGHSDVAPERKQDPGELFSWILLAKENLGFWPKPNARDRQLAAMYSASESRMRDAFTILGYDPKADLKKVIVAFNRRFSRSADEELTSLAAGKLACLVRHKREILNKT